MAEIPTDSLIIALIPVILALITLTGVYFKYVKPSNKYKNVGDIGNIALIDTIQDNIKEIKNDNTAHKLDTDKLNTRLSTLEGMFAVFRDQIKS